MLVTGSAYRPVEAACSQGNASEKKSRGITCLWIGLRCTKVLLEKIHVGLGTDTSLIRRIVIGGILR